MPPNFCRGARFTWHQRRRHALVRRLTRGIAGKRILDYGCGYGDLTFALSKNNSVVGIDVDADRIAFCRSQYPELEFQEFDGRFAPMPNASFDVVLSSVVLPFVSDHAAYLADVRRVLKDTGQLILVTRNPAVVNNALRKVVGRSKVSPRLNTTSRNSTRDLLKKLGFSIDYEDYFYDPPFIGWSSPKAACVGAIEQFLSVVGHSAAAAYVAWRAHLAFREV